MNNYGYLGIVQGGTFRVLAAEHDVAQVLRLTRVGMEQSVAPESDEITLNMADGIALYVRGVASGDWIYAATVVEEAGPILSTLVRHVISDGSDQGDVIQDLRFPQG